MRIFRYIFSLLIFFLIMLPAFSTSNLGFHYLTESVESWVDPLIQQRGAVTTRTTNNATLTINKPTGVVTGDVMIINISLGRKTSTSAEDPSLSGWTLIGSARIDQRKNFRGAVLYKVATDADAAVTSYTFNLGTGTTGGVGAMVAFANVDVTGATPFDAIPGPLSYSADLATTSVITNGVITSKANAAILMFAQSNVDVSWDNTLNSATAWRTTNPSSLTELYDVPFTGTDEKLSVGSAWALKTDVGQTGNGLVNQSASANFGAIVIALKPISTVAVTPSITSTLTATSAYGSSSTYQITASYDPTSFSATGLPSGMSLDPTTGLISIAANTAAGDYAISLSATNATGTGNSSTLNYSVSKKALSITATNVLKCFGVTHTFNTTLFTSNGLIPGETISAVDMTSTGATSAAVVGVYSIVPSNATGTNGFLASNYEITYQTTGTLSVRPLNSWHGSASTAWANTANWCLSGTQVPGATDAAIIYPSNNAPELGDALTLLDLTINSGASVLLKSPNTLTLLGSLTNDGLLTMEANSRVVFGTGAHTISGTTITSFLNLTVNAGSNITLNQSIQVTNNLTLTSGYLVPATDKSVTLANGATVTGASNTSYIRGTVKKIGTNGNANYSFIFPIGKPAASVYDPVTITFPNASTTEEVSVAYTEAGYNTLQKNSNVREVANEYWTITPGPLVANAAGLHVKLHYKGVGGANYFTNANNVSNYKVGHYNTASATWEVAVGLDAAQNNTEAGSTLVEGFGIANGVTNFSRFTMLEIVASVLPIQLSNFTARVVPGNAVLLNWTTHTEQQNKGFYIERASAASQGKFQKIGYVSSKAVNGFSTSILHYTFTEPVPQGQDQVYYRLLQEDRDGKTSPTEIKSVRINYATSILIKVESTTGRITIGRGAGGKKMNFRITDQLGRIVSEGKAIADQVVVLQLGGNGVYTIHLVVPETGEQLIKRVLVQK